MATEAPIYDLILLLDTQADEERRTQIAGRRRGRDRRRPARSSAATTGACARRPTRSHKSPDADYHLIQFHGRPELLEQLDHTLKITDGVLRFRIIKLRAGTPAPPDLGEPPPRAAAAARASPTRPRPRFAVALRNDFAATCGAVAEPIRSPP